MDGHAAAKPEGGAGGGKGKGAGAGRGKGQGGKGKGKDGMTREVRISKALTQILRHKAESLGLEIRSDGYMRLEKVLGSKMVAKLKATPSDVEQIARNSDKQRFELMEDAEGVRFIRAVQGHSMKIVQEAELMRELSAEDADLPENCVHGTYRRHLKDILREGLKAGGRLGLAHRNHVHFAPFTPGDARLISGMRWDSEVVIWVNLGEAIRAGVRFFMAKNQVILTPGLDGGVVPPRFFLRVTELPSGAELWPTPAGTAEGEAGPASAASSVGVLACDELRAMLCRYVARPSTGAPAGRAREDGACAVPRIPPQAAPRETSHTLS